MPVAAAAAAAVATCGAKSIAATTFLSGSRIRHSLCNRRPLLRAQVLSLSRPKRSSTVRFLFTGIVEEIGTVRAFSLSDDGADLEISAVTVTSSLALGDSVAVDGACLTVASFTPSFFTVGLAPETLRRTNLHALKVNSEVNLERALTPASRMGGHFVQGHVDGTGEIVSFRPDGDSLWVKIRAPPEIVRLLVPKGFVAVDGASLTVVGVYDDESCFDFMLVKYSQQHLVLPRKKVGDLVNLEADILGKYVDKLLAGRLGQKTDELPWPEASGLLVT